MKIINELSWTTKSKKININEVSKTDILKAKAEINKSVAAVEAWIYETKLKPTPPSKQSIKPIVDLFGYDPYVGELYRGIRSDIKADVDKKLKVTSVHSVSSWTPYVELAKKYASLNYLDNIERKGKVAAYGYVVRLNSAELQFWNMRWYLEVLNKIQVHYSTTGLYRLTRYLKKQIVFEEEVLLINNAPMTVTIVKLVKN